MTTTRPENPHEIKRRFRRAASINTVLVTAVDGEPLDDLLKTHSVGRGGCGFNSRLPLKVDAVLDLMISLRFLAFKVTARVAYCYRSDDDQYEIGCEFLDLASLEQQHIEQLVASSREASRSRPEPDPAGGGTAPVPWR